MVCKCTVLKTYLPAVAQKDDNNVSCGCKLEKGTDQGPLFYIQALLFQSMKTNGFVELTWATTEKLFSKPGLGTF